MGQKAYACVKEDEQAKFTGIIQTNKKGMKIGLTPSSQKTIKIWVIQQIIKSRKKEV